MRKIVERIAAGIITCSGFLTSIVILLIVVFLFSEGLGLFSSKTIEEGYSLVVNKANPVEDLDTSSWEDFNREQIWGGHREYYWFETTVTIPEQFDQKCVVYELITGREGEWDATNPQFTIYVNGKLVQGLDVNHREIVLAEKAEAGAVYRITLSAFTGDQNFSLKLDSKLKVLDRKTEKYFYDLSVPYETARLLNPEDRAYITIIQALNDSLNLLDMRREVSLEFYDSLEKAQ